MGPASFRKRAASKSPRTPRKRNSMKLTSSRKKAVSKGPVALRKPKSQRTRRMNAKKTLNRDEARKMLLSKVSKMFGQRLVQVLRENDLDTPNVILRLSKSDIQKVCDTIGLQLKLATLQDLLRKKKEKKRAIKAKKLDSTARPVNPFSPIENRDCVALDDQSHLSSNYEEPSPLALFKIKKEKRETIMIE